MAIAQHERVEMKGEKTLKQRYKAVKDRVAAAARRCGRSPDGIIFTVVTKYAAIDQIRELIELGHVDFGESRVQNLVQRAAQIEEFLARHRQLTSGRKVNIPDQVRWHMIGGLQRNKVRKVINLARLIHSVDSLRLAEEIQQAAAKREEPVEILLQVNTTGDKTKSGVAPAAAMHLLEQIDTMMSLCPRGLMCMAPLEEDPQQTSPVFERCRELFDEIKKSGCAGERFDILSMGMSNDFEVAIENGSNLVRIGTAVFGKPDPSQLQEDSDTTKQ